MVNGPDLIKYLKKELSDQGNTGALERLQSYQKTQRKTVMLEHAKHIQDNQDKLASMSTSLSDTVKNTLIAKQIPDLHNITSEQLFNERGTPTLGCSVDQHSIELNSCAGNCLQLKFPINIKRYYDYCTSDKEEGGAVTRAEYYIEKGVNTFFRPEFKYLNGLSIKEIEQRVPANIRPSKQHVRGFPDITIDYNESNHSIEIINATTNTVMSYFSTRTRSNPKARIKIIA